MRKILIILFWLLMWQMVARLVHQELFLASPLSVAKTLILIVQESAFWHTIFFSGARIISGFLLALMVGVILSIISYYFSVFEEVLHPLMLTIKTVPVASFVILILLWFGSRNLSSIIAFLMGLPVIYNNTLQGLKHVDVKMLEMCKVFRVSRTRQMLNVFFPSTLPFFRAGCMIALGLCWKSGIAAELIGIPSGGIGERLYQAKIYLSSGELFAWTIVIVCASVLFEKLFLSGLDLVSRKILQGD